jgi:hypothetical protein
MRPRKKNHLAVGKPFEHPNTAVMHRGQRVNVRWCGLPGQDSQAIPDLRMAGTLKRTSKRYSLDFKVKVALEAIRSDLTLVDFAARHSIHHRMIAAWRRQAIEAGSVWVHDWTQSMIRSCEIRSCSKYPCLPRFLNHRMIPSDWKTL